MKRRGLWRTIIVPAAALLLSTHAAEARSPLRISAEVTRPEYNLLPVTVTVTGAMGDTLWSRTSRRAFNRIKLPANGQFTVSFAQPYCITKQVVINASEKPVGERSRKLAFEVILEPDPNGDMVYAGPVGRIEIDASGVQVKTERRLVHAD